MAAPVSLMEFVQLLAGDARLQSDFAVDPSATLSEFGLEDLSPADVRDAIVLVEDNRTVDYATAFGSGSGGALAFGAGAGAPAAGGPDDPTAAVPAGFDAVDIGVDPPDPIAEHQPVPDPGVDSDVDAVLADGTDLHLG